jgi:hypothetical protein
VSSGNLCSPMKLGPHGVQAVDLSRILITLTASYREVALRNIRKYWTGLLIDRAQEVMTQLSVRVRTE